jgi:hypothetical protein
MKIVSAKIVLDVFGTIKELDFPQMPVKDLAHELIEIAQPKLEIAITESQVKGFQDEAKKEYMKTKLFNDFEAYIELYTRLKIDAYIRLEHAKQAYNEVVLAYSNQIKELKAKQ